MRWQFLAAPEQGTVELPNFLYRDGVNHGTQVGTAAGFNVGEGDFSIVWRGIPLNVSFSSQRIISKGTTSQGFSMYATGGKLAGFMRFGSTTLNTVISDYDLVNGQLTTAVFQRKGVAVSGTTTANRSAANYETWINGTLRPSTKSFSTLASANVDSSALFYVGKADAGSAFPALDVVALFYRRALEADEIAGIGLGIYPPDGVLCQLVFNQVSGEVVPDISSAGNDGVLSGYTATDYAPATNSVWLRGATTLVYPLNSSTEVKQLEKSYTFTRVVLRNTTATTASFVLRDQSGNAKQSGTLTFTNGVAPCAITNVAGDQLEATIDGGTSAIRTLTFL